MVIFSMQYLFHISTCSFIWFVTIYTKSDKFCMKCSTPWRKDRYNGRFSVISSVKARQGLGVKAFLLVLQRNMRFIIVKGISISLYYGSRKYVQAIWLVSPRHPMNDRRFSTEKNHVRGRGFSLKRLHFAQFTSETKLFLPLVMMRTTNVCWHCVLWWNRYCLNRPTGQGVLQL